MRFPDSSPWPHKCQISHLAWKSDAGLPLPYLLPQPALSPQQHSSLNTATDKVAKELQGQKVRPASWQRDYMGKEKLGGSRAAISIGSQNVFTLHTKRSSPDSVRALLSPAKPLERLSWRSRSKETTKKRGHRGLLITQRCPEMEQARQKYQSRNNRQLDTRSRAEASLVGSEETKGRQEGPADRYTGQLITTEATDETKI